MTNDELNELERKIKAAKLRGEVWVATYDDATTLIAELRREREKVKELYEAISPGRIGEHAYYIGVAAKMRERELRIRPLDKIREDG